MADGEQFLGVGAGAPAAAYRLGDRQVHIKPPVQGPAMAFSPALHDRRSSVEDLLQMFRQLRSSSSGLSPVTPTWLPRDPAIIVDG